MPGDCRDDFAGEQSRPSPVEWDKRTQRSGSLLGSGLGRGALSVNTIKRSERTIKPLLDRQELKKSVNSSRFERFAWLWANEERHERLELLPSCLHRCLQRLPAIYQAAAALECLRRGRPWDRAEGV